MLTNNKDLAEACRLQHTTAKRLLRLHLRPADRADEPVQQGGADKPQCKQQPSATTQFEEFAKAVEMGLGLPIGHLVGMMESVVSPALRGGRAVHAGNLANFLSLYL